MDIDPDIANWILEFILRHPISDQTLTSLLGTLPLPDRHHPHLQKCILLRKLQSDAARNSISLRTLDVIERLEAVLFWNGNESPSRAMKHAYCAVAVEITVKQLFAGDVNFKFFEAVKRVWRGRIGKMVEGKGLYSQELWAWKNAVWEDDVRERVVERSGSVDAVGAVERFVREEWGKMGPPFLDVAAKKVESDGGMQRVLGLGGDGRQEVGKDGDLGKCDQEEAANEGLDSRPVEVGQGAAKEGCRVDGALGGNVSEEMPKKRKKRDKLIGVRRIKSLKRAGVKIVDPDETTIGPSNYDLPGSAEVNKVREALVSSCSELHAIVKDPLPKALNISEQISGASGKDKGRVHGEFDLLLVDSAGVVHGAAPSGSNANNVHKPSLMERNNSAHAYEVWDGSIDGSEEDRDRLQLPSPQVIINPPLNEREVGLRKRKRRAPRKWSPLEENTLRTEVEKYGKGQWKYILTLHRDIFGNRTEVDLKDKWRNMTK